MTALFPLIALLQGRNDEAAAVAAGMMGFGCLAIILFTLAMVIFPVFCFWRIFAKAGHNGAMALLCLIPGVGMIIVLCILAFGDCPALRDRS